jgi:hypothetical protein
LELKEVVGSDMFIGRIQKSLDGKCGTEDRFVEKSYFTIDGRVCNPAALGK